MRAASCLILTLFTAQLEAQSYNWTRSPVNGRLYALCSPMPWHDAETEAQRVGGHLATVRSQDEHNWLLQQFGPGNYWIGLNDEAAEGTFVWASGESVNFTNWCAGQPDASSPDEDFVHMANYPGWCAGGWNDQQGTDTFSGIMELPFDPAYARVIPAGGPAGLPLQTALDIALPGDTVQLQASIDNHWRRVDYVVDKSLTLDGNGFSIQNAGVRVRRTTNGIPVILHKILLVYWDTGYSHLHANGWAFACLDASAELRFDSARILNSVSDHGPNSGGYAVDVLARDLWMRDTHIDGGAPADVDACSDWQNVPPESPGAIRVFADRAFIEGCSFRGGDGANIYAAGGGWIPNCPYIVNTQAGNGGPALDIMARYGTLANTLIIDGTAGTVIGSPPGYSGQPGIARPSNYPQSFVQDGGLTTTGSFAPGGQIVLSMSFPATESWWVLIGIEWTPIATPWGALHTKPLDAFSVTRQGAFLTIPIPNDPSMRGIDLMTQAIRSAPTLTVGNPSAVNIR